ncbi:hypothetical protein JB92DRAFT_3304641 [Gautieria morchelliformis]|nr:hypothetical protein JB92DRAFT_3304641 [Gautieria morchelliformis]
MTMSVISGPDPLDNFILIQPQPVPDFTKALQKDALKGVRLGVPILFQGNNTNIIAACNASLEIMKELGATIVDVNKYIASLVEVPNGVKNMADLITADTAVLHFSISVSPLNQQRSQDTPSLPFHSGFNQTALCQHQPTLQSILCLAFRAEYHLLRTAFSEFNLISYAFAYEQERHKRLKRLASPAAIPKTQLKDILGSNKD